MGLVGVRNSLSQRPADGRLLGVTPLGISHRSTVMPEQIDDLGHMNVQFYGVNAVAATGALLTRLGLDQVALRSTYTRHHREQMVGNELEVRSGLLGGDAGFGSGRLAFYHELRNQATDELAAAFVHELDHPSLGAATAGLGVVDELPEHGRPRSLRLESDGLASAPSLERVRSLDLASRKPRVVDSHDTLGGDTVPPQMGGSLLWGGERFDDQESWVRTLPNGARFAFVVMESRMWIRSAPIPLGTSIQTFRASVEIGEKVGRDAAWCYDTSTGEPLVAVEAVDLCFNMNERRSMSIPPGSRSVDDPDFHPDLAPR